MTNVACAHVPGKSFSAALLHSANTWVWALCSRQFALHACFRDGSCYWRRWTASSTPHRTSSRPRGPPHSRYTLHRAFSKGGVSRHDALDYMQRLDHSRSHGYDHIHPETRSCGVGTARKSTYDSADHKAEEPPSQAGSGIRQGCPHSQQGSQFARSPSTTWHTLLTGCSSTDSCSYCAKIITIAALPWA